MPRTQARSVPKMTHPAAGMTRAQLEAFERIAIGLAPQCKPQTLDALVAAGLVTKIKRKGYFGPHIDYDVPLDIHRQWCDWCAEQPDTVKASQ